MFWIVDRQNRKRPVDDLGHWPDGHLRCRSPRIPRIAGPASLCCRRRKHGPRPHRRCVHVDASGIAVIEASVMSVPVRREYDPRS
jgi:hypothetical protein